MATTKVRSDELAIHGGIPVRDADNPISLVFPRAIAPGARENIDRLLDSGFALDMIGEYETAFAETMGRRHAVALSNCTDALHAVLAAIGVGPGDDVVVSPITDYGSVKGIFVQGAKAIFPDVDVRTGLITAEEIEKVITPQTKAIIAVHMYGQVCDMDPIVELAREHDALLIEDVCQAPFATYGTRTAGTIGDVGCYSFEAEKHISTDHGGMAITDDDELAAAIRYISHERGARPAERGTRVHETIGHAFRYGRLEAAVGLAQLPAVPEQNRRRVELANELSARLRNIDGVTPPFIPSNTSHVYWLYHFRVATESFCVDLGEFIDALNAEGLRCGPAMYYLIPYSHTFIEDREAALDSLPKAREHLSNTIRWPWTDKYSDADIADIAAIIAKVADAYRK
jgi:dTDP-4-amino-4,6-dideoxygalactose transaminase